MATQKTVDFKVFGQKVTVKSSEADPEVLAQVIELVNLKLKEAERRCKGLAPHHGTFLALLDLAEDYVRSKRRTVEFKRSIHEKTNRLMSLLELDQR